MQFNNAIKKVTMRKMRNINKTGLLVIGIIVTSLCLKAQVPTYQCVLKNDSLLTNQVYEFDVYLKNTSTVTFELANFQVGILVDPLIVNGGTLSVAILPGSSQFNIAQIPSDAIFSLM